MTTKVDDIEGDKPWWKNIKFTTNSLIGGAIVILGAYTVISSGISNDRQEEFVKEQVACNQQLIAAIGARSKITADDNRLDELDRKAQQNFLIQIIQAPPGDNERVRDMFEELSRVWADTELQRQENQKVREANPYPDPRCDTR